MKMVENEDDSARVSTQLELFSMSLPEFDREIIITLENGGKILSTRKRHPIYRGEDCYVVSKHTESKFISWVYF